MEHAIRAKEWEFFLANPGVQDFLARFTMTVLNRLAAAPKLVVPALRERPILARPDLLRKGP